MIFLLLAVQPVKLAAELVKVLALGGKPCDLLELPPELFDLNGKPRGFLGLLYQQLGGVWRGHVHLPFLDAAAPGGGSLGLGRGAWAWLG